MRRRMPAVAASIPEDGTPGPSRRREVGGLPVFFVLQELTVPAGERVTGLAEELQRFLLVDRTEHGPLSC